MKAARIVVGAALLWAQAAVGGAQPTGCADPDHAGGEWRSYGGDLNNSRDQVAEGKIGPDTVGRLAMAWSFRTSSVQAGGGGFSNTPVVADGCVYLASNSGFVYALDADTGTLAWKSVKLPGAGQTLLGGVIVGSPVVAKGAVYVGVSRPGTPYVTALDQETGVVLWTATVEGYSEATTQNNALINASPVYLEVDGQPMIFMGFAGNEGGSVARGGFAIVDASSGCSAAPEGAEPGAYATECTTPDPTGGATGGRLLAHTYTINDAEYAAGYRGASVWCTAAADPSTGHVYACGGNPASKRIEHRFSNALLKIDADPSRATFGQIVDSYKGNVDQYYPGLDRQPLCDALGDTLVVVWSLACLQLDLDFGSSPNLFRDSLGNLMLGDLQKSGIYHTVFADHMEAAWSTVVGTPCFACNAASPAYDDARKQVYTATTTPSAVWALTSENGRYRWAGPIGEPTHFQPVSTANGVVYTMDAAGGLNAFDAVSGVVLMRRPLSIDVNAPATDAGSQGVSIARNTVYAATGEFVVAYRIP